MRYHASTVEHGSRAVLNANLLMQGMTTSVNPPATIGDQFTVAWLGEIQTWRQAWPVPTAMNEDGSTDYAFGLRLALSPTLIPTYGTLQFRDSDGTHRDLHVPGYVFPVAEPHIKAYSWDFTGPGATFREAQVWSADAAGLPGPDGLAWQHVHTHPAGPAQQYALTSHSGRLHVANNWHTSAGWPSQWNGRLWWVEVREGMTAGQGEILWRFDAAEHPGGGGAIWPWTDPRGRTWEATYLPASIVTPGHPSALRAAHVEVV